MTVWFTVKLDDRPGALARMATALAERGVNIAGIVGIAEDTNGELMLETSDPTITRETFPFVIPKRVVRCPASPVPVLHSRKVPSNVRHVSPLCLALSAFSVFPTPMPFVVRSPLPVVKTPVTFSLPWK